MFTPAALTIILGSKRYPVAGLSDLWGEIALIWTVEVVMKVDKPDS